MSSTTSSSSASSISSLSLKGALASTPAPTLRAASRTAWSAVKRHAREHHEGVNGAYDAYYGQGVRTLSSSSSAGSRSEDEEKASLRAAAREAWQAVARRAAEHHASVSGAHELLYHGRSAGEVRYQL